MDENDRVRLGGDPAPFREMLSLWIEEFAPLAEGQTNTIITDDEENFACTFWSEVIHLQGAEMCARMQN